MIWENKLICGDCQAVLKEIPDESVDLIFTSPPYAEQRKDTYGGIPTAEYTDWFLNKSEEFKRVLKPTGNFVLNIRSHCHKGERDLYVYKLVIALREVQGWKFVDDMIWAKYNPVPGKYNNRLKNGWENLFHFTKGDKIKFYPDRLRQPLKPSSLRRVNNISKTDREHLGKESASKSGFSNFISKLKGTTTALPSNVILMSQETSNKLHSAVFPMALPEFFITLMTNVNDIVLDPFMGSGTTCAAAKKLGRVYVGIDKEKDHIPIAVDRVRKMD